MKILIILLAALPALAGDVAVLAPVASAWGGTTDRPAGLAAVTGIRAVGLAGILDNGLLLGVEVGADHRDAVIGWLQRPRPLAVGIVLRGGTYSRRWTDNQPYGGKAYGGGIAVSRSITERVKLLATLEYSQHTGRLDNFRHGAVLRLGFSFGRR